MNVIRYIYNTETHYNDNVYVALGVHQQKCLAYEGNESRAAIVKDI